MSSSEIRRVEWFGLLDDVLTAYDPEMTLRRDGNYGRALFALLLHDRDGVEVEAEVENMRLRELARMFAEYVDQDRCEGCVCKSRCGAGLVDECWQLTEIREAAARLGIEVGEE